jgi:hypothetical protein
VDQFDNRVGVDDEFHSELEAFASTDRERTSQDLELYSKLFCKNKGKVLLKDNNFNNKF